MTSPPEVLVFLASCVLMALPHLIKQRKRRADASVWRSAAQRLGLTESRAGSLSTFEGKVGELRVSIQVGVVAQDDGRQLYGVRVEVTGPLSTALVIDADGLDFGKLYRAEDLLPGEHRRARLCAVLDAPTRRLATELTRELGLRVQSGVVSFEANRMDSTEQASRVLEGAVELARRLSLPESEVPARLLHNAENEPLPEVKLHNHKLLLLNFPKTPEGQRGLELARTAGDAELNLLRAELLNESAFETAHKIALAEGLRAQVRLKALTLAAKQRDARLPKLLARLIVDPTDQLSRAATRLVRREHADAVLAALVTRAADVDAAGARELLKAFVELDHAAAEPGLLALLGRDDAVERAAVVQALGKLGSLRAVEPLLALEAGGHPDARDAITAIQSRLGNAEAGRLSVVKDAETAGGLSLIGAEAGGLAIVKGDSET